MTFLGDIIELYLQKGNFLENLMPSLNKEAKKPSMLKMQLTTEQSLFVLQNQ